MTAAKAFCILSALLGGGSIYYTKRNDLASTRLLFLAYSMLLISVLAELRRVGALLLERHRLQRRGDGLSL